MSVLQKTNKSILVTNPATHGKVLAAAKKSGVSVKETTTLLLQFALGKLASGEIQVSSPEIKERSSV
jgi:hypothetical protein